MESEKKTQITVSVTLNLPLSKVWKAWTTPEDIKHWNNASNDWHTPKAENDLRAGGKFSYRMEARDGSFGFDFWGIYDEIKPEHLIAFTMGDERKVRITFTEQNGKTEIIEVFEAESTNPIEMQKSGWQAILNNFKEYAETKL